MITALKTLHSAFLDRMHLASYVLGSTFAGRRDMYRVLGYKEVLRPADYRFRYQRGGIAAAIVEALPHATWRGTGVLFEDADPNVHTPFETAWDALSTRLNIWSTLQRADILAGLGRYAVVLIGAPGQMSEPLPLGLGPESIAFLLPIGESEAIIDQFITDTANARFGKPEFYQLRRTTSNLGIIDGISQAAVNQLNTSFGQRVHWTRVLHIADGVLDDEVFGTPRLERVWNDLDNIDKIVGGGSETFWLRANQGMQLDLDKDLELGQDELDQLKREAEDYEHGLRRIMRTRGVKIEQFGSDVATFDRNLDACISLIAATTRIPKRILMGSEMGELASSQDRNNWIERVQDRRTRFAGPCVVRPLVDRFIACGVLPKPVSYEIFWPEVQDIAPEERVGMGKSYAEINSSYGDVVVTRDEIRELALGLKPLTAKQLASERTNTPPQAVGLPEAGAA